MQAAALLLLLGLLAVSHLAEGHRQLQRIIRVTPSKAIPVRGNPQPSMAAGQATGRAAAPTVNGTYILTGSVINRFEPDELSGAESVPAGYGNVDSSIGVTVQDWVEFGWQNTVVLPPLVASVDITQVPTGYTITWTENLGGPGGGNTPTVTLSSDAFQACTSITRDKNTFPATPSEELSGNTVTLVTGRIEGENDVYEATWSLNCPRMAQPVAVVVSGPEMALVGEAPDYVVKISNLNSATAPRPNDFTVMLPPGLELDGLPWACPGAPTPFCTGTPVAGVYIGGGTNVTCLVLEDLPGDTTWEFKIPTLVTTPGEKEIEVLLTRSDDSPADNTASTTTSVPPTCRSAWDEGCRCPPGFEVNIDTAENILPDYSEEAYIDECCLVPPPPHAYKQRRVSHGKRPQHY